MPNYKYEDSETRATKLVAKLIREAEIRGLKTGARLAEEHQCSYDCYATDGSHTEYCKYDIAKAIELEMEKVK